MPLEASSQAQIADAIVRDDSGQVTAINVAGLMAAIHGVGTAKPARIPYGAEMRPQTSPDTAGSASGTERRSGVMRAASGKSPILCAHDSIDESAPEAGSTLLPEPRDPVQQPAGHRARALLRTALKGIGFAIGGLVLALVILLLFPTTTPLGTPF